MSSRLFSTDEELGKKDDDHKPGPKRPWARHIPIHYRRRRTIIVLAAVSLLFLLRALASSSTDDDAPVARGGSSWASSFRPTRASPPEGPPPRDPDTDDNVQADHFYGGKIKFFDLAESLHKITSTNGLREKNRNALFAASNLQSVSALLPMACEMAKWNRNFVHFAVMGRNDIPLGDILEVNGIDKEGCAVIWHDARPDYVLFSSDRRAEAAVKAAMGHIHNFMHPQVVITDDPQREDLPFVKGMAQKTREHNVPIIEIPRNRADTLEWLTRLDTGSLKSWHRPTVDILIHAPPKSSGSLVRLLKSITAADYAGLVPPRILIDLPADIDPPTLRFLERVVWPPNPMPSALRPQVNQIILKHRIPRKRLSEEEVSIRFLESFYPTDPADAHVMLLNANTELSPLYYQYLIFHLLEYKYSPYAGHDKGHLFGISLEVPQFHLNGTTAFEPPLVSSMRNEKYQVQDYMDEPTPFTWVAPNSNAALYFGDKWSEIHSFLANRLAAFELQKDPTPRPRTVHESQPSWMEYFLELMRARNYFLHYPGIDPATHALVTVHNELYQPPEGSLPSPDSHNDDDDAASDEFSPKTKRKSSNASPFLTGDTDAHKPPLHDELSLASRGMPLHQVLPFDGDPPELNALPLLLHNGTDVLIEDARTVAEEVTRKFREAIGGCGPPPEGKRRKVEGGSARDLFCFGDEGEEVWEREKGMAKSEKEAIEAEELGDDKKKGGAVPKAQEKKPPEKGRKSYMGEVLPSPDEGKKTDKKKEKGKEEGKSEDKPKDEENEGGSAKKTAGPDTEEESKEREEKEEESESKEMDDTKDDTKGDDKDNTKDKKDDRKSDDDTSSSSFGDGTASMSWAEGEKKKDTKAKSTGAEISSDEESTSDRGRDKERPRDKDI